MTGKILIACVALLLLGGRAGAQETVELRSDTQHADVYQKIWFLLDDTGTLTLDQVIASPEKFQRNKHNSLNFGHPGPVIWLRLDVANIGARDGEWLFASRLTQPEILEIYLRKNGNTQLLFTAADRKAAAASLQRYFVMVAPFSLNAGEAATLYAKYRGTKTSRMPLSISSFEAVSAARQDRYLINGIIAAIVIALVAYSTAIFLIISGRTILYYAASETAMLLIILESNSLLSVHLWPESLLLQKIGLGILNAVHVIFTILFTLNFFQLPQRAPRIARPLQIWMGVAIAYLAITALLHRQPAFHGINLFASYALLTPLWLFLPILAAAASWRWDRNYWPLIPGWAIVVAGHLYWVLILRGLVGEPPFHPQLIGFIVVVNAIFLSIALVLQVRQRQQALNKALQEQLSAANARAEMLREMADQGRLMRAAGHDTRTILLGVRTYAAGLQGTSDARVATAANAITHLADDLESVLGSTLGAIGSGGETILAIEPVPLAQILNALRLIHERPMRGKSLRFQVRSCSHELVTDRALLSRIVGNLVDNAENYTTHGGVIVAARRHGDCLRIQVWDSGSGIDRELLHALMSPGTAAQRGTDITPGQGSGLQIAKSLAARIGGAISACSRPGHGSLFELVLPRSFPPAAAGSRLWILDSDAAVADKIAAMAQGIGAACERISAADFYSRTDVLRARENDLVLIDLHFGGALGGIDAAKRFVSAGTPRSNILISTYDRGVDMRVKLAAYCGTILYQPVTAEVLKFVLNQNAMRKTG